MGATKLRQVISGRMARTVATAPAIAAAARYRTYCIPGEELYLAEIRPAERADIVIDNRDFDAPRIMRDHPGRGCFAAPTAT